MIGSVRAVKWRGGSERSLYTNKVRYVKGRMKEEAKESKGKERAGQGRAGSGSGSKRQRKKILERRKTGIFCTQQAEEVKVIR